MSSPPGPIWTPGSILPQRLGSPRSHSGGFRWSTAASGPWAVHPRFRKSPPRFWRWSNRGCSRRKTAVRHPSVPNCHPPAWSSLPQYPLSIQRPSLLSYWTWRSPSPVEWKYSTSTTTSGVPRSPRPGDARARRLLRRRESRQLHRDRPLWEMWSVEGLEDGKIALVAKMHHSTIDGVSGAELLGRALRLRARLGRSRPRRRASSTRGDAVRLRVGAAGHGRPAGRPSNRPQAAGEPRQSSSTSGASVRAATANAAPAADRAPHLHQHRVHARRRTAFAAASLTDAKRLKNARAPPSTSGAAVCTGALRTYLMAGDELPEIPLVSVVPVSVTPDVAELRGSNKVSAMFVPLRPRARPARTAPAHRRGHQGGQRGAPGARRDHAAELGRARLAPRVRFRPLVLHGHEVGRPPPPGGQPRRVQRAGPRLPPVSRREPAARDVPVRAP